MTDKPIFENLFINDKYQKEMEELFDKAKDLYMNEGKAFPLFQNNNFLSSQDAEPQSISIWLNEKDGKRFATYKKEKRKVFSKENKPKQENKEDNEYARVKNGDDDLPFQILMLTHGELNMTYWTEYYKKNAEKIKERQKNRYENLSQEQKKELLEKGKLKRKTEAKEEREIRLSKQKERYLKNRDARLEYQKRYNQDKKNYTKQLEEKLKSLENRS